MNNKNRDGAGAIEGLRGVIDRSRRLCVFTGAGISCPSGIPDFRSAGGIYSLPGTEGYTPEQIVSHTFLMRKPERFFEFYRARLVYPDAKPNAAHRYFASLETPGRRVDIITQNIDGLHGAAGSVRVLELHGAAARNYCVSCGKRYGLDYIINSAGVPRCGCGGMVRPDVVLYEEPLDDEIVDAALKVIGAADTLVVVGTSLTVYPAAAFVDYFRGETLAVINRGPTPLDGRADYAIYGDAAEIAERLQTK